MSATDFDITALEGDLDLDQLEAVLSGGREKGQYKSDALAFIASGSMGRNYKFSGKKAQSVKTGFESAVDAITKDESVDDETKAAAKDLIVKIKKVGEGDSATELVFLARGDLIRAARQGA